MSKNTNIPAFPLSGDWNQIKDKGMDLRDFFAAKAMQAFITLHENALVKDGFSCDWSKDGSSSEIVALEAYGIADAMMKAREE